VFEFYAVHPYVYSSLASGEFNEILTTCMLATKPQCPVTDYSNMVCHLLTTCVTFPTSHGVLKWRLCGWEITHSRGLKWTCMFFMLTKVILHYWYFKSSWNHTVCLHLIFMAVLWVPINHEQWNDLTATQKLGRHWPPPCGNTIKSKRMRQLKIIGAQLNN
jgi:hypothetical protein